MLLHIIDIHREKMVVSYNFTCRNVYTLIDQLFLIIDQKTRTGRQIEHVAKMQQLTLNLRFNLYYINLKFC